MRIIAILLLLANTAFCQIETSYVIKPIASLNSAMYAKSKQANTETCRRNISGTKLILKFEGDTPEIFKGDQIYGHSAIIQILSTDEWSGYSGGIASVGKFFITDYNHRQDLQIKINEWMYIRPVKIKDNLWAIPYDVYVKYKSEVDNNIDLYKCVIRRVKKNELIESELN